MKGTLKLRLSLEGHPPIPNIYQRLHSYFFLGGGGGGGAGKIILNCWALLLERPPLILNVYQRRRFVGVGGWGIKSLKLLRLSLKVPPPIR